MKKYLLLLLTLVFAMASFADKVTEQQALQKAQKFFKEKQIKSKNLRRAARAGQQPSDAYEDYYVFNAEDNGGFVIISGDDCTEEILGYADSGSLDMDTLPPNLKWWLSEYSMQIKAIDSLGITKRCVSHRAPKEAIATLMTTKWGQDAPYNMNCPDFFDTGYKCLTGCVATAMAQVMYYHRAKSTRRTIAEIPGYYGGTHWQSNNMQLKIDAIPEGAIIDWDNILDRYDGSETDFQKDAVANLMFYCGVSVIMDYGPSGSGAYSLDVPVALKSFFDYSEHTKLVWRQDYTEANWDELIYSELSKGNPIYYSGSNNSVGHAFVCDGYDGNGYYHINWGWDGLSDSYFLLSALNPGQQGTGGSSAGYNDDQCALIGAVPNGEIMRLTSQSVLLTGDTSFILSETGDGITVPVRWKIQNMASTSCNFDYAVGLYHNGELVKVIEQTGTSEMFAANQEKIVDASLVIETNLFSGIYQLYALSRSQDEEKWFRNDNSSDCFITLVVKDGSMSFYVGKPAAAENVINFADHEVKRICVENWDTDGDGEISYEEAASVTDFGYVFDRSNIKNFDEAQYFTGITSFGLTSSYGFGCSSLTSIKLPSSVTSIRDGGFFACKALTSIDIPSSVKVLGEGAFQACFSLREVVLHEGLEKICDMTFYKCGSLSSFSIPASVTSIGKFPWGDCTNLDDFDVDDNSSNFCAINGVLFTKDQKTLVFYPCKREGIYNIPIGTEIIKSYSFFSSSLEDIVFPESVTTIGDYALEFVSNVKEFTIPSTIINVGKGVFWGCSNLKNVVIEGSRLEIPKDLFAYCRSLTNIILPEDIKSIGDHAFYSCAQLTEITIPSKVTSIGDYAFAGSGLRKVRSLMQVPCAITSTVFENIYSDAILYVPKESIITYKEADNWNAFTQILAEGEYAIEKYAELANGVLTFYHDAKREERTGTTYFFNDKLFEIHSRYLWLNNASSIIKVVFDTSFGDVRLSTTSSMFDGCDKLTEIQGIENLNTSEVTDMSTMFQGCRSLTSIDLSYFNTSKVTSMRAMFWDCANLKTVNLPDDLAFIDSYQFVYCSSLSNITVPASVTSIGARAYHYCSSLEEITIPAKVSSIGDNAFSYSGLTKVRSLMQTPCEICSTVFENVSNNATLYVPAGCKAAYEAADYWKDFKKIMGPSSNLIYMVDGEVYHSYEIEHGSAITPEPAPTKEGYTFSGWSEIPATMPDHDVIITGTFEPFEDEKYTLNGHEYVNLGLPSGKYWSTMNYGAEKPEDAGSYLTGDESGVVATSWGISWKAPDMEDIQELIDECVWTWTSLNGVAGYNIMGPNGNSMFLPAAGTKNGDTVSGLGSLAYYQTASKNAQQTWVLQSSATDKNLIAELLSSEGYPIRPVSTNNVEVTEANFPDENFRNWILSNIDAANDGVLTASELESLTSIECPDKQIKDLKGIEFFSNLTTLNCWNNELTFLDVSHNPALRFLNIENNQLKSLDVSHNLYLNAISCGDNKLKTLNLGTIHSLTHLNCCNNQLTSLDVSNNPDLTTLTCWNNQLTSLDVSNNTKLPDLRCYENELTSLKLGNNTVMTILQCSNNQLTTIDVSKNSALMRIDCDYNQLSSLDVSHNTALEILFCSYNQLTSLDVSNTTALTDLGCDNNKLTSLDLSNSSELISIKCSNNQLTYLDVSKNNKLGSLWARNNLLSSLDLTHNNALQELMCELNQLTSIDVSNNKKIEYLWCSYNLLTSLDVSENTELKSLMCHALPMHPQLIYLDLSHNTKLETLCCNQNQLLSLDLSHNTSLSSVDISPQMSSLVWSYSALNIPEGFALYVPSDFNLSNVSNLQLDGAPVTGSITSINGLKFLVFAAAGTDINNIKGKMLSYNYDTGNNTAGSMRIEMTLSCLDNVTVWTDPETEKTWIYNITGDNAAIDYNTWVTGDIVIPSKINGKTVTGISHFAFQACSGLTSLTIPSAVTGIGDFIVGGCAGLKKIVVMAETPPTISDYTFVDYDVPLYVPDDAVSTYQNTDIWKRFTSIRPLSTANQYSLVYMIDGEVYKTYTLNNGDAITPEPAPTKEGYTFSGWSEIPETMPAHDVVITGSFSVNSYTLTYKVDGEVYKTSTVAYGTAITPEPAPTKEGYTFSGWSEIPETMPAHDVTVTGSFTINKYKLTYMIDDKVYKETMYEYGATITPEPQPEGDYATFEWTNLPRTMPAHDVVVYATYTTGIIDVLMANNHDVRIYSPNGKRIKKLQKGLNIVVLKDGTVKKVVVNRAL